jgi:PAS domain S-box-containing protein
MRFPGRWLAQIRSCSQMLRLWVASAGGRCTTHESQIQQILEALPVGVSMHRPDGSITYLNSAGRQILQWDEPLDLSQASWRQIFSVYDSKTGQPYLAEQLPAIRALQGETVTATDLELRRSHSRVFLEMQATPLLGSNRAVIASISVFRDITDRKQVELEKAKETAEADNRAKSAFLANMSHDLRTPLNAILGYGQLMAQDAQTPQQQAQLDIINRNGESLLQIIDDMLWLNKIESGQVTRGEPTQGLLARLQLPVTPMTPVTPVTPVTQLPMANPVSGNQVGRERRLKLEPGQAAARILVVDDTDTNRMLMAHWLKRSGFEMQQAQNGQVAVEQAVQFRPDLIWMDMRMPMMDGYDAMRRIRQEAEQMNALANALANPLVNPAMNRWQPKIIALTAAAFEAQQTLAAGFDDFVTKPCPKAIFFDKMAQHLHLSYAPSAPPAPVQFFSRMPEDWIAQLNYAARSANEPLIFELLEALPADCQELKASVTQLVHDFQLGSLIRLTQPNAPP